jgi:hypothetical protein
MASCLPRAARTRLATSARDGVAYWVRFEMQRGQSSSLNLLRGARTLKRSLDLFYTGLKLPCSLRRRSGDAAEKATVEEKGLTKITKHGGNRASR